MNPIPGCQVVPLPDDQAEFLIGGRRVLGWHFGSQYPRPFFYPAVGPSGQCLIRMGHPGAPNHDHHRGIWFAHHKVTGIDFWGDQTTARIRQHEWLAYQDGKDEAVMAVRLHWLDGHDPRPLLEQDLVACMRPATDGQWTLELQSEFRPVAEQLEFGQTNFGFLAVRVAKTISAYFGGGTIRDSEGREGEPAIFGKPARWMDYSGAVPWVSDPGEQTTSSRHRTVVEGITYFDHPENPGYPNHWHVREDGWMGLAPCLNGPLLTTRAQPLQLRFLLHIHRQGVDPGQAEQLQAQFAARPRFLIRRATEKHTHWSVTRHQTR